MAISSLFSIFFKGICKLKCLLRVHFAGKLYDFEKPCGIVVKVLRGFLLRNPAGSGVILPKTVYVASKDSHNGGVRNFFSPSFV